MTEQELIELCSLGESTTVQYKLEFTTQKNEDTTQKANKELISATQKEDVTTQKRILDYLKDYQVVVRTGNGW